MLSAPAGTPAAAAGRPYLDFGARLYDPRTAAWLSQDPMAEKYYDFSPYAYCAGNPVNLVDPTGMDWYYLHQDGTITLGFKDNEDKDDDYLVLGYWEKDSIGPSLSIRVPKAVNLGGLSQDISSANLSHAISSSDESIIDLFDFVIHHSEKREWAIASFKGEDGSRTYGLVQGKKDTSVPSPTVIQGLEEKDMITKIHTHEGYIQDPGGSGYIGTSRSAYPSDRTNYEELESRLLSQGLQVPAHYVYEVPNGHITQYNKHNGNYNRRVYSLDLIKSYLMR